MSYIRKVASVIDGDTFKVASPIQGETYMRISGIDKPEEGEPGYHEATRKLRKRILGRKLKIDPVARDTYGRLVVKIRVLSR